MNLGYGLGGGLGSLLVDWLSDVRLLGFKISPAIVLLAVVGIGGASAKPNSQGLGCRPRCG